MLLIAPFLSRIAVDYKNTQNTLKQQTWEKLNNQRQPNSVPGGMLNSKPTYCLFKDAVGALARSLVHRPMRYRHHSRSYLAEHFCSFIHFPAPVILWNMKLSNVVEWLLYILTTTWQGGNQGEIAKPTHTIWNQIVIGQTFLRSASNGNRCKRGFFWLYSVTDGVLGARVIGPPKPQPEPGPAPPMALIGFKHGLWGFCTLKWGKGEADIQRCVNTLLLSSVNHPKMFCCPPQKCTMAHYFSQPLLKPGRNVFTLLFTGMKLELGVSTSKSEKKNSLQFGGKYMAWFWFKGYVESYKCLNILFKQ